MKDLYTALGGAAEDNIYAPGFGPDGNACASRLSVAFNLAGGPINSKFASEVGAKTLGTADTSRIVYRVSDFRKYLLRSLGKPTKDDVSPFDNQFRGKTGIVAFSVNWQGASGHIALWNGSRYREPRHDNYSTYVSSTDPKIKTQGAEFWEIV